MVDTATRTDPAAPGPYLLHACSAAVVADFSSAFIANHPGQELAERPQLEWLSDKTQLVTLPTGGNDAHFADVMGYCAKGVITTTCRDKWVNAVSVSIKNLRNKPPALYGQSARRRRTPRSP